jgi:phosphatidylglycerol lysyltransferase
MMSERNLAHDQANAHALVMAYGWNTTAYQILNPGFEYWFAPDGAAVVAYVRRQNVMLVAGAPVCAADTLGAVTAEFEQFARDCGYRVCYVCAAARLRRELEGSGGHSAIVIGAQPVWDPRRWIETVAVRRSIRQQIARARNKGVTSGAIPSERAGDDPELKHVLDQWLAARCLPPMRFLVEPHTLDGVLSDRLVLAARHAKRTVAFLVASPVAARNGFLIEQLARSPHAPNGSSELLIDAAMRHFAEAGRAYATLGLVALASNTGADVVNPWWFRLMTAMARTHANRFYNFRGLERFRLKLAPAYWETIFAISNERRFSMRTLYAVGEAFSGISPWLALGLGIYRAAGQEFARLRGYGRIRRSQIRAVFPDRVRAGRA